MTTPLVVAGMTMRMQLDGGGSTVEFLGGPALGAGVGARVSGVDVELVTALSTEDREQQLPGMVDAVSKFVVELPRPALRWAGPAVRGNVAGSPAAVTGDPSEWRVVIDPAALDGRRCALANADPRWYAEMLRGSKPRFVALDLSGEWSAICAPAIRDCLASVHVVTITEEDYRRLPLIAQQGVRLGFNGGPVLVIKRGSNGVVVRADGLSTPLPAPAPACVRTDAGAGDVLLGCLAAQLDADGAVRGEEVCDAYERSLPTLARLLAAPSFDHFWRAELCAALPRSIARRSVNAG